MMKKLRCSIAAKTAAVVLLIVSGIVAAGCVIAGIIFVNQPDFYFAKKLEDSPTAQQMMSGELDEVLEQSEYHYYDMQSDDSVAYYKTVSESDMLLGGNKAKESFAVRFSKEKCALSMTVTDSKGNTVLENYSAPQDSDVYTYTQYYAEDKENGVRYYKRVSGEYDPAVNVAYVKWHDAEDVDISFVQWAKQQGYIVTSEADAFALEDEGLFFDYDALYYEYKNSVLAEYVELEADGYYTITCAVGSDIVAADEFAINYALMRKAFELRKAVLPTGVAVLILGIACIVFLIASAGWRRGKDTPTLGFFERIPLEIYLALCAMVGLGTIYALDSMWMATDLAGALFIVFAVVLFALEGLLMLLSLITRIKCGEWWKHTLIYMLIKGVSALAANWSLAWRIIVPTAAVLLLNGILAIVLAASQTFAPFALMFLLDAAVMAGVCFVACKWSALNKATARIASGEDSIKVDTNGMTAGLRRHAENINRLGEGVSAAVAKQLASERMRTDLITNVSHDLKTPLTSIVNYVDLLKSRPIEDEDAVEYVEVLERQAARLKRLVEDLVEASKASSGCITANVQAVNVKELLTQAVEEYSERLNGSGVEAVIGCENDLHAMADGSLLWRVFDNLLSNACKYAQTGTRLYIDAKRAGNDIEISFRNTSREPLNISADELLERFVRGDKARTTEGSGLGLSIAQSLVELQKGQFRLDIDGDLFKATIVMPKAESTAADEPSDEEDQ